MNQISDPRLINNIAGTVTKNNGHQNGVPAGTKKKRRNPMHVLKVAMYMLALKSGKSKSIHTDVTSKWKKFLSSMRPLHIQANQSPPRPIEAAASAPAHNSVSMEEVVEKLKVLTPPSIPGEVIEQVEVFTPPCWSPPQKSVASSFFSGQTSKYASAHDLQELDLGDESDEDEDGYYDDKFGDDMIDMKAEQFIAKFYHQMKLQRKTYT